MPLVEKRTETISVLFSLVSCPRQHSLFSFHGSLSRAYRLLVNVLGMGGWVRLVLSEVSLFSPVFRVKPWPYKRSVPRFKTLLGCCSSISTALKHLGTFSSPILSTLAHGVFFPAPTGAFCEKTYGHIDHPAAGGPIIDNCDR